jgi:NAD-dependent deacetylase
MESPSDSGFGRWLRVILRGLAQVAFADSAWAGLLVLAGTAVVAPWSALGALTGAVVGTVAGRFHGSFNGPEWELGLGGPNPAIVGILWGGALAGDTVAVALFALALLGCIGLEQVMRPLLARIHLPVLSAPAMVVTFLVVSVYGVFGGSFWHDPGLLPFGEGGVAVAILLIVAAMATKSPAATLQTVVVVATVAVVSGWLMGGRILGPVGLWAFAAAPAAFGMHAVFLAGSAAGSRAGLLAAILAAGLWFAWMVSPLAALVPPLLIPFILATWLAMGLSALAYGVLVFDPHLWAAAANVRRARDAGKSVVALTGAGVSTNSGIPDYISGAWLKPGVPVSAYSYERFLSSPQCRRAYWDACADFRRVVGAARPNGGHHALAAMEHERWLTATVTQNVDGLHQAAGSRKVVSLHGRISHVRCLSCGAASDWPPSATWQHYDLHCSDCSGLIKPAVIAMGENIPPTAWQAAEKVVADCGVMVVVGSQMVVSSAFELLMRARQAGAEIVIVSLDHTEAYAWPGDNVLSYKAEAALPALALLLDCPVTTRS